MGQLVLQPTVTASWHALVSEAEFACGQTMSEDLESYLVFLLQRFTTQPDVAARVLALDYLRGINQMGQVRQDRLREVGDTCLLFSGLFPERVERLGVSVDYFVDLGRQAYATLAELQGLLPTASSTYRTLTIHFVSLMDLLHTMRELGGDDCQLSPLHAAELWQATGSRHALQTLKRYTQGTPVVSDKRIH